MGVYISPTKRRDTFLKRQDGQPAANFLSGDVLKTIGEIPIWELDIDNDEYREIVFNDDGSESVKSLINKGSVQCVLKSSEPLATWCPGDRSFIEIKNINTRFLGECTQAKVADLTLSMYFSFAGVLMDGREEDNELTHTAVCRFSDLLIDISDDGLLEVCRWQEDIGVFDFIAAPYRLSKNKFYHVMYRRSNESNYADLWVNGVRVANAKIDTLRNILHDTYMCLGNDYGHPMGGGLKIGRPFLVFDKCLNNNQMQTLVTMYNNYYK